MVRKEAQLVKLDGGTVRYVYDGADRPVCRLEEDRIKTQNAFLMHCEGLDGYISEEAETLICREKSRQVLYYHGKKAGSIYSRLEEVYHDLSIPPGEKMPDYGEEGRETSYTYDGHGREKTRTNGEGETEYRLEHDVWGRQDGALPLQQPQPAHRT